MDMDEGFWGSTKFIDDLPAATEETRLAVMDGSQVMDECTEQSVASRKPSITLALAPVTQYLPAPAAACFYPPGELSKRPDAAVLQMDLEHLSKELGDLTNRFAELKKPKKALLKNPKKALPNSISSNLCAIWGRPASNMSERSLMCNIFGSCSEKLFKLLQSRLADKCENSSEASSSMDNAISDVHGIMIEVTKDAVPIHTLLEALLNLCGLGDAVVAGTALRILFTILQHLLSHGIKSNQRNNIIMLRGNNNTKVESNNVFLNAPDMEDGLHIGNMFLPSGILSSFFTPLLEIALKYSEESICVDALFINILIVRSSDHNLKRAEFELISAMGYLHQLLQKGNGLVVKNHSVHLLFLLLNCSTMMNRLMEAVGCENSIPQEVIISSILTDLSECLTSTATTSVELKLCRQVINLLAYISSWGDNPSKEKLGYQVLLRPVTACGASFLELIMKVLASQMEQEVIFSIEVHQILQERYFLMREALILLNRLASHAIFSKNTLEVLTGSKYCSSLTMYTAYRLPQRSKYPLMDLHRINPQMADHLAGLAQKFKSRVYGFTGGAGRNSNRE